MRYIQSSQGIVMAPRLHMSHRELFNNTGIKDVLHAGFVSAIYEKDGDWKTFGESVGLNTKSKQISPSKNLYVAVYNKSLIYSDNPELLKNGKGLQKATWDFTNEIYSFDEPIYAPQHSEVHVNSNALFGNW